MAAPFCCPLRGYCQLCARHIDGIHLELLSAIALYRRGDSAWRGHPEQALAEAERYRFVRIVSIYGVAVLPLLEETVWAGDAKWYKRLMSSVRMQAAYYPAFLQPRLKPDEALTATEQQILRLICAGKSNADIGKIMDIKLPTVKTHVSHILDKLGGQPPQRGKNGCQTLVVDP